MSRITPYLGAFLLAAGVAVAAQPVADSRPQPAAVNSTPAPRSVVVRRSRSAAIDVPAEVAEHSLVRVSTDIAAGHVDMLVMSVQDGAVQFVDCVQSVDPNCWIFTGPPGTYSIRLSAFESDRGFVSATAHVTIRGEKPQPPKPTPDPKPEPDPPPQPVPDADSFTAAISKALKGVSESARNKSVTIRQGDGHTTTAPCRVAIAGVYRQIATEASDNPTAWSPSRMVSEAKVRNASTIPISIMGEWSSFWPALAKAMVALKLDGLDTAKHIKAFRQIAEVLSE